MSINKLFDTIDKTRQTAQWQAAFGEPQVLEDQTLIPVAQVGYGFGLGFATLFIFELARTLRAIFGRE